VKIFALPPNGSMSFMGQIQRFPRPRLSGRCDFESDPLLPTIRLRKPLGQGLIAASR
jgi:hypothetical protein